MGYSSNCKKLVRRTSGRLAADRYLSGLLREPAGARCYFGTLNIARRTFPKL